MGVLFLEGINGRLVYTCCCRVGLADEDNLISSNFRGLYGSAALFHKVQNVSYDRPEKRAMLTGSHIVRSIRCLQCGAYVGWYYEFAEQTNQQGKEGKYVLELQKGKKQNRLDYRRH